MRLLLFIQRCIVWYNVGLRQLERVLGSNLEAAFRRMQQMRGGPREVNISMRQTTRKKFVEVQIKGTAVAVQVRWLAAVLCLLYLLIVVVAVVVFPCDGDPCDGDPCSLCKRGQHTPFPI